MIRTESSIAARTWRAFVGRGHSCPQSAMALFLNSYLSRIVNRGEFLVEGICGFPLGRDVLLGSFSIGEKKFGFSFIVFCPERSSISSLIWRV